ncbi:MAG: Maf family protein [Zavarzinella sp.]
MQRAGYEFDVLPPNVEEPTEAVDGNIRHFVQNVAWIKAAAVAPKVKDGVIIAADSVSWIDNQVVGKPTDRADAHRIIKSFSGRTHELWTGVCCWLASSNVQFQWQECSTVAMKALSDAEIEQYLDTRQWEGCSGAYAIDERNDPYLTVTRGSVTNVIGLPMESLADNFQLMMKFV